MTGAGFLTLSLLIAAGLLPGIVVLLARRNLPGSRADAALLDYLRLPAIVAVLVLWWLGLAALAVALAGASDAAATGASAPPTPPPTPRRALHPPGSPRRAAQGHAEPVARGAPAGRKESVTRGRNRCCIADADAYIPATEADGAPALPAYPMDAGVAQG